MKNAKHILAFGAGLAALGLFMMPSTVGFVLEGGSLGIGTSGNGYQRDFRIWNNAADAVANNNNTPDANFPGALGAVMAVWKGARAWNSDTGLANKNFDFDYQRTTTSSPVNANVVSWGNATPCQQGAAAFTTLPISDGWNILMCDNLTWDDGPGTALAGIDIQGVVSHELGHALGLDHTNAGCGGTCTNDSTMCPVICGNGTNSRDTEVDDENGLQAVYGVIPSNKPRITSLTGSLAVGQVLTINGLNFPNPGNVHVKFTAGTTQNTGAIPGVVFNVPTVSATQINVTIPATAQDGNVLVWMPGSSLLSNAFPIDVGAGPPPVPTVTLVTPFSCNALNGGTITVLGNNFTGATAVNVGTETLTAGEFTVVNVNTITFSAPNAPALGPNAVTVTNGGGTSNPGNLTYNETQPLLLIGPGFIGNGTNANYTWGGKANQITFLLMNLDGTTFNFKGTPMLNFILFVNMPNTDAVGIGGLTAPISGVPVGVNIFTQIMTVAPPGTAINTVQLSNISQAPVLF